MSLREEAKQPLFLVCCREDRGPEWECWGWTRTVAKYPHPTGCTSIGNKVKPPSGAKSPVFTIICFLWKQDAGAGLVGGGWWGTAIESTCILNKTMLEFSLTTFLLSDFNKKQAISNAWDIHQGEGNRFVLHLSYNFLIKIYPYQVGCTKK